MKKLLLVLAVAGAFAACGNKSGSDSDKKADSTATPSTTAPTTDTTHKMDSSATKMMSTDSTKKN